jgi:hypothetical protein
MMNMHGRTDEPPVVSGAADGRWQSENLVQGPTRSMVRG